MVDKGWHKATSRQAKKAPMTSPRKPSGQASATPQRSSLLLFSQAKAKSLVKGALASELGLVGGCRYDKIGVFLTVRRESAVCSAAKDWHVCTCEVPFAFVFALMWPPREDDCNTDMSSKLGKWLLLSTTRDSSCLPGMRKVASRTQPCRVYVHILFSCASISMVHKTLACHARYRVRSEIDERRCTSMMACQKGDLVLRVYAPPRSGNIILSSHHRGMLST